MDQTDMECFVSGPSGLGYTMPINTYGSNLGNQFRSSDDFAAFVDAQAKLNIENLEGTTVFGFVCPADMAKVRKALKEDLKYVEAFAKSGYVGTVGGVNLYTKKDAVAGTIVIATKEAVTLFNKKGTEVAQEREENIRKNSIFSRKYYLAALTDETKAVKITIA